MHVSLPKRLITQIKPVQQRRQQLTLLTYTVLKWVKVQCTLWGVSFFYVCKCIVCMCMKTECSVKKWPFQLCHKGDTVGSPDLNLTSNIHIRVLQHCATPSMATSLSGFQALFSIFFFLFFPFPPFLFISHWPVPGRDETGCLNLILSREKICSYYCHRAHNLLDPCSNSVGVKSFVNSGLFNVLDHVSGH